MTLTPEQQTALRVRIAELQGWRVCELRRSDGRVYNRWMVKDPPADTRDLHVMPTPSLHTGLNMDRVPEFATDLNAMHEVEKGLIGNQGEEYVMQITQVMRSGLCLNMLRATATQRALAYVLTMDGRLPWDFNSVAP